MIEPFPLLSTGGPVLPDGHRLSGVKEEEENSFVIPPDLLLAEENDCSDPKWDLLKEEVSESGRHQTIYFLC